MKDLVTSLKEKASEFGNHYNKYIQAVSKHLNTLIQRLEENKKRDAVHILHPAYDFEADLKIVAGVGRTTREKLDLIGTFFALQFLHFNHQAIDQLRMDMIETDADKLFVYRKFMRNVGDNFRRLITHYIVKLLEIFLDTDRSPEFVILSVGTKSDQDDIDVGIIDDCKKNRARFNRAIARISQEMFRFAVSFHFHLSEHIGDHLYSASIKEYKKVLTEEISDYVIINEMLSAAVITGSKKLFEKYQKEIINRYFFHPSADNRYHEGYLRGILGDVYQLLEKPISSNSINFKEDGLRIIKNIICAQKTIFNIKEVNTWDIIEQLKKANPRRKREYNALERSLTFFEIFRYLYQLFVTQDEEILLDDTAFENIRRVAKIIGYQDFGTCRAEEHLLMHYYEHIQNIRNVIPVLINDITDHLTKHSIFSHIFDIRYQGNLAEDFIQKFRFFRGTSFWNDILDNLRTNELLEKFVRDFDSLPSEKRNFVIKEYIEWFKYNLYSLINLLTILGENKKSFLIFKELNEYLMKNIDEVPDFTRNIAYVFNRFPNLINNYFSLNEEKELKFYLQIFQKKIYEKDVDKIIGDLRNLISMHLSSSVFFKRIFLRILDKYPKLINIIKVPERLREFADGLYSDIDSMRTFKARKEKLGDYYDCEFIRVGIKTLSGGTVEEINSEFTQFSDRYIHTLFDICRMEIDRQYTRRIITDDLLAIFAAGGHAREQAYDDDYDIIVLLNSDNPEMLDYCNKIISKMNNEIIKRSTIPHHRFTDYFGRFVILLDEVKKLLSEKRADIFIEKSQILGARLIVGSHRFEEEFLKRIIKPHIFKMKREYINQMIEEINSRHSVNEEKASDINNDIKEGPGGLRDIEMMMLIMKAEFELKEPVNSKLFKIIIDRQKNLAAELTKLAEAFSFLNHLRNVYRLTSAASDTIIPEALETAAEIMGYKDQDLLYKEFKDTTKRVRNTINLIIKKIKKGRRDAG